jgi:hypothetical protein
MATKKKAAKKAKKGGKAKTKATPKKSMKGRTKFKPGIRFGATGTPITTGGETDDDR